MLLGFEDKEHLLSSDMLARDVVLEKSREHVVLRGFLEVTSFLVA